MDHVFGRRFSTRLNNALDQIGFPSTALDRARALGLAIRVELSMAASYLNGKVLPGWEILASIFELTGKQPGYFFDETLNQTPKETKFVKPLLTGGDIVLHVPDTEITSKWTLGAVWTYVRARQPMGFEINEGDYVINYSTFTQPQTVHTGDLYLLMRGGTIEVARCREIKSSTAVFDSSVNIGSSLTTMIAVDNANQIIPADLVDEGIDHFGTVAAIIRPT